MVLSNENAAMTSLLTNGKYDGEARAQKRRRHARIVQLNTVRGWSELKVKKYGSLVCQVWRVCIIYRVSQSTGIGRRKYSGKVTFSFAVASRKDDYCES